MQEAVEITEKPRPKLRRRLPVYVGMRCDQVQKLLILATLEAFSGDKVTTALQLGISLKTLYNRLNAYGGVAIHQRRAG